MRLSIVATLYCSAAYVDEFCDRVGREAQRITPDYEIVLVNDGSPDDSLDRAIALHQADPHVKIVDLSRNFGHHKAMMTGLMHATGDLVFLLDCDLEEPPELLGRFYETLTETGADVVYGVQDRRRDAWPDRLLAAAFYRLYNALSSYEIPADVLTARLMTRRYVSNLVRHRDHEVAIAGLWALTGFTQVPLVVAKSHKGASTYTVQRRLALVVDSVTAFSNKPLVFISYLGLAISAIACLAAAWLVANKLFFGGFLMGWPSLIVSIWLLGGLTILCLGVIGLYLSRIFVETKDRPYTVIREIYDRERAP